MEAAGGLISDKNDSLQVMCIQITTAYHEQIYFFSYD